MRVCVSLRVCVCVCVCDFDAVWHPLDTRRSCHLVVAVVVVVIIVAHVNRQPHCLAL